jgi:hypothetical protein
VVCTRSSSVETLGHSVVLQEYSSRNLSLPSFLRELGPRRRSRSHREIGALSDAKKKEVQSHFEILGKMGRVACAEYERCLQKDTQGSI